MRSTQWTSLEVSDKVNQIIAEETQAEESAIGPDVRIVEDLGADSLSVMEMVMTIEGVFSVEIPDQDIERLRTPRQICDYLAQRLNE